MPARFKRMLLAQLRGVREWLWVSCCLFAAAACLLPLLLLLLTLPSALQATAAGTAVRGEWVAVGERVLVPLPLLLPVCCCLLLPAAACCCLLLLLLLNPIATTTSARPQHAKRRPDSPLPYDRVAVAALKLEKNRH
jgi:hypothetical protein